MFTKIFSQISDGSTPLIVFANVDEAKSYFFSADALSCIDSHTSQVAYQLVADENGDNTKLKKTEGFDTSGIGETYNTVKTALIEAGNWGINGYTIEDSTDHLF
jgi:hypothetical protein